MNDFARSVVAALSLIGNADPELLGIVALSLRVPKRGCRPAFELPVR
jgi:ABC-type tungstate transport system substrate-binding protein